MISLFHGTSSKKASKIVMEGFRIKKDDCIFFAEDVETAKFFGSEKAHDAVAYAQTMGNEEHSPEFFTVIKFMIPEEVAVELELTREQRQPLGVHTGMSFPDISGSTGYERILIGDEAIRKFNSYIISKTITFERLKFRLFRESAFF